MWHPYIHPRVSSKVFSGFKLHSVFDLHNKNTSILVRMAKFLRSHLYVKSKLNFNKMTYN